MYQWGSYITSTYTGIRPAFSQIELLDPTLVPGGKDPGGLPVVDGAGARKVRDENSVKSVESISS